MILPNVSGTWIGSGIGYYTLSQSGNRITGTAGAVNKGDHWGEGHRNGGSITGVINNDGTIILRGTWGDGTFTKNYLRLSADQKTLSGTWNWYTNSSMTSKKGSGNYSVVKK